MNINCTHRWESKIRIQRTNYGADLIAGYWQCRECKKIANTYQEKENQMRNPHKFPRTMSEAFGPYAEGPIETKPEFDALDAMVWSVIGTLFFSGCVIAIVRWLA